MAVLVKSMCVDSLTDKGELRDSNEDDALIIRQIGKKSTIAYAPETFVPEPTGCLLVVADGMGGAAAGEIASHQTTQALSEYFSETTLPDLTQATLLDHLERSIYYAQVRLINLVRQQQHYRGMGTTVVIAWVVGNVAHIGWVGDSRCYLMNPSGGLKLLTNDHSVVWQMVMSGQLTPEEAALHEERNIITQSLGSETYPPSPDYVSVPLQPGDRLLLCSDGLNVMLADSLIETILRENTSPTQACRALVNAANEAGGEDNITVIVLEITEAEITSRDTADGLPLLKTRVGAKNNAWSLLKNLRL